MGCRGLDGIPEGRGGRDRAPFAEAGFHEPDVDLAPPLPGAVRTLGGARQEPAVAQFGDGDHREAPGVAQAPGRGANGGVEVAAVQLLRPQAREDRDVLAFTDLRAVEGDGRGARGDDPVRWRRVSLEARPSAPSQACDSGWSRLAKGARGVGWIPASARNAWRSATR